MSNFAVARSTLLILLLLSSSVACVRAAPDKVTVPLIAEGKPDPADPPVTGYLCRPEGAAPFPAVILLQGCGGLAWRRPQQPAWQVLSAHAERFTKRGYVALLVRRLPAPRGRHGRR